LTKKGDSRAPNQKKRGVSSLLRKTLVLFPATRGKKGGAGFGSAFSCIVEGGKPVSTSYIRGKESVFDYFQKKRRGGKKIKSARSAEEKKRGGPPPRGRKKEAATPRQEKKKSGGMIPAEQHHSAQKKVIISHNPK